MLRFLWRPATPTLGLTDDTCHGLVQWIDVLEDVGTEMSIERREPCMLHSLVLVALR